MQRAFSFFDLQHSVDNEKRPLSESSADNPFGVPFEDGMNRRRCDNAGNPTHFNRSALEQAVAHQPSVEALLGEISNWLTKSGRCTAGSLSHAWSACSISRWLAYYALEVENKAEVSATVGVLYKASRGLHTALSRAVLGGASPHDSLDPTALLQLAKAEQLLVRQQRTCAAPDAFILSMLSCLTAPCRKSRRDADLSFSLEGLALYAEKREQLEFASSWLVALAGTQNTTVLEFEKTAQSDPTHRILLWGQHSAIGVFLSRRGAPPSSDWNQVLWRYGELGIHIPMRRSHTFRLAQKCLTYQDGRPDLGRSITAFVDLLADDFVAANE